MTDKELFLCPTCAVLARRLRPELDAGIVELDSNAKCPLCGGDAVVSVHRLGKQITLTSETALQNIKNLSPQAEAWNERPTFEQAKKLRSPTSRNETLNFLIEHCPEAACWWDGWYDREHPCWLFPTLCSVGGDTNHIEIELNNKDGSEAVVVIPVRTDLTTWSLSKLKPKVETENETKT
jgi:hypothetical protein